MIGAIVIVGGFVWFERSRPSARVVAAVAAMAALGVAGRLAFAPFPNVVATTDVALLAGYTLGGGPGFAVGALSALVSNFWLGQGPWTPWQMTGWGAVGIFGAILAGASGRRLGRLQLALAGALAGLAYGALLDLSVMVSFGGEQSLERYLALSARGLPFNFAHAIGNFVLMFAAGPAMVRMLARYRERFQVRWSDAPLGRAAVMLVLVACLLAPLLAPSAGVAGDGRGGARDWLQAAQNDDGGFGTDPDSSSSPGMTGWAMLGLEAAGVNPRDLLSGENSPVGYLRDNEERITSVGDLERTILALEGAGVDSRAFQGRDLVGELRKRQGKDGSFQGQVNLTAFAILAQRAAGVERDNVSAAARFLRSVQNRNGGWGSTERAESEPDSTGSAIQALAAGPGGDAEIAVAAKWLEKAQGATGGWSLTPGQSANTQSTAWALQGLVAAGRNPGTIKENGRSGIDFIASRQGGDGHYTYSSSSDQTPVWVTAQGLTGAARAPFPIDEVARAKPEQPAVTPSDGGSSSSGGYSGGSIGDSGLGGSGGYDSGVYAPSGGYGGGGGGFGSGYFDGAGGKGNDGGAPGAGGTGAGSESELSPAERERIPANGGGLTDFVQSAASPAALPAQSSPLPATIFFVVGLGLLAVGLGVSFLRYRKRLTT